MVGAVAQYWRGVYAEADESRRQIDDRVARKRLSDMKKRQAPSTVVDLSNRELSQTNLRGRQLFGAKFKQSNLQDSDFSNADLRGADFTHADVQNTNFQGANMAFANLRRSNAQGADFFSGGEHGLC